MYPRLDRADLKHAREFQRTNMEQLREYERERLHEIRKLERKRNVGLQEGERQTLELLKYNKISLQPSKLRYPFGTFYTLKEFLKSCTKTERLIFKMVLQDIKVLLSKRLTQEKELTYLNLLHGIMNLWEQGYCKGITETEERYNKKLKLYQKDIRDNKLFPCSLYIYEIKNSNADGLESFIIRREGAALAYAKKHFKEHRKELVKEYSEEFNKDLAKSKNKKGWKEYILNEVFGKIMSGEIKIPKNELKLHKGGRLYIRNNRLCLRKNTSEGEKKSLETELANIKRITLFDAMVEANKQHKIFPEKEFEQDKIKIYDRLKHFDMKHKSRKKLI